MIERVAAAIMDSAVSPQIRARWDDQPEEVRTHWRLAARAAIAAMREPLEQAKMSIIAASIGSCDCNTKSPDPVHHLAYCRWLKLMVALDCIDAALSEGKSDD